MKEILAQYLFISLFEIVGAAVVGNGWRRVRSSGLSALGHAIFSTVFGSIFMGVPLIIASQSHWPLGLLASQFALGLSVIFVMFFLGDRFLQSALTPHVFMMGFGGIFVAAGLGVFGLLIKEREWLMALIFMVTFVGSGSLILGLGLRALLRGDYATSSDDAISDEFASDDPD